MSPKNLPEFGLRGDTKSGRAFRMRGSTSYRAAADHVWRLPYGRNSRREDYDLVLSERRGTCSTKHALLAALAREHEHPVELRLGIYEMDEVNTPGVGAVLHRNRLTSVPEAHCYLMYRGVRVDLTRADSPTIAGEMLHEEIIAPEGIGAYKLDIHREFVREWAASRYLDFDTVWCIREECIGALSGYGLRQ